MLPLYDENSFKAGTSKQTFPLRCKTCLNVFHLTKRQIQKALRDSEARNDFCSQACNARNREEGHYLDVHCNQCGVTFQKALGQIQKSKHNFCGHSCAARYQNSHKQTGTRRSKLEKWLGEQLVQHHPDLEWHFNRTDAIEAKLDIYTPTLKLAFELNGIFHYEPIYGADKLDRTHQNDHRKLLACAEHGIELCVLDTSKMLNFKEKGALRFLQIIEDVLDQAIGRRSESALMPDAT